MACGCSHKETKEIEAEASPQNMKTVGRTKPTEQCIYCAGKHLAEAWECWHEQGYRNEDLRHIQGALRAMVLHTYQAWPGLAKLARECAVSLQKANFPIVEKQLDSLCKMYDEAFATAEPAVAAKIASAQSVCDIVIPLGSGSAHNNIELRYCLRSIAENAIGLGRVIIVSDCAPSWLSKEVVICEGADVHTENKDSNLIDKTIKAINDCGIINMCWMADDNVILEPTRLSTIPTIVNKRVRADYIGGGRWRDRVLATLDWADARGVHLDHSLESHAPQTFLACDSLPELARDVDYTAHPVTIMTMFHVLLGTYSGNLFGSVMQDEIKSTYEKPSGMFKAPDKRFAGYNDAGYDDGMGDWLAHRFPTKCRFER